MKLHTPREQWPREVQRNAVLKCQDSLLWWSWERAAVNEEWRTSAYLSLSTCISWLRRVILHGGQRHSFCCAQAVPGTAPWWAPCQWSAARSCHILSSELCLLPTHWEDANHQLHSLPSEHSSSSVLTYEISASSEFFFLQMFLNICLIRHGLSEADFFSATQCVRFTIPRCCNFQKIKNVPCPKLGMGHNCFTCLGSPLNEE